MIRFAVLLCAAAITAIALFGCARPQVVQATDCRGAVQPCGLVFLDRTHAMSSVPVTVPVGAIP